jgi:hypothetical protein
VKKNIDFLKIKWNLGFKDRGMGHGDFAVLTDKAELVAKCLSKEIAEHIIELHSKTLEKVKKGGNKL